MIPWVHLDTAKVPGTAKDELRLMQRGSEFAIFAGPTPLMNSRMSSSEIMRPKSPARAWRAAATSTC